MVCSIDKLLIHYDFSLETPIQMSKKFIPQNLYECRNIIKHGYVGTIAALFDQMTFNTCVGKNTFQFRTLYDTGCVYWNGANKCFLKRTNILYLPNKRRFGESRKKFLLFE